MWSQARNSFALDGLDGTWNFRICIPESFRARPEKIRARFFKGGGRDRTRFILRQSNFVSRSERLAALAVRHSVPTVFENREFIAAGGLMGYGGSFADTYSLAGIYVARTLKGEKSRRAAGPAEYES